MFRLVVLKCLHHVANEAVLALASHLPLDTTLNLQDQSSFSTKLFESVNQVFSSPDIDEWNPCNVRIRPESMIYISSSHLDFLDYTLCPPFQRKLVQVVH